MQDTDNLVVSRPARVLAVSVYRYTAAFPDAERFGLTSQMRRAAVSILSNIAEGCGRRTNRELVQFLYHASGSASELASQVGISMDLGLGQPEEGSRLLDETRHVSRMLAKLIGFHRAQPAWRRNRGSSKRSAASAVRVTDQPAESPSH